MKVSRILVTGSRTWTDRDTIERAFRDPRFELVEPVTLVSGACPFGADYLAEEIALALGWRVELHPAAWRRHGRRAGYLRNAKMVELGADVCIAFIKNNSPGATMTANLAEKAGIPVIRYREDSEGD